MYNPVNHQADSRTVHWKRILSELQSKAGTFAVNNPRVNDSRRKTLVKILRSLLKINSNYGAILLLFVCWSVKAANPAFTDFNTNDFSTANHFISLLRSNLATKLQREFFITNYGGIGDGVVLNDANIHQGTTNIFSPSAAFTQADVGKIILVYTNQSTTLAYSNALNTVRVSNITFGPLVTIITTVLDGTDITIGAVPAGGATASRVVYGTDNTIAFQNAINAAALANGGIVQFDGGMYCFAGPLQDASGRNGVILLPTSHGNIQAITVRGVGGYAGGFTGFNPTPASTDGTILFCFTQSSAPYNAGRWPAFLSGNDFGFTSFNLLLQDMELRVPAGGNIGLVNMYQAGGIDAVRVQFGADFWGTWAFPGGYLTSPNTNFFGCLAPQPQNNAVNYFERCDFRGMGLGLDISDHGCLFDCQFADCTVGLRYRNIVEFTKIHFVQDGVGIDGSYSTSAIVGRGSIFESCSTALSNAYVANLETAASDIVNTTPANTLATAKIEKFNMQTGRWEFYQPNIYSIIPLAIQRVGLTDVFADTIVNFLGATNLGLPISDVRITPNVDNQAAGYTMMDSNQIPRWSFFLNYPGNGWPNFGFGPPNGVSLYNWNTQQRPFYIDYNALNGAMAIGSNDVSITSGGSLNAFEDDIVEFHGAAGSTSVSDVQMFPPSGIQASGYSWADTNASETWSLLFNSYEGNPGYPSSGFGPRKSMSFYNWITGNRPFILDYNAQGEALKIGSNVVSSSEGFAGLGFALTNLNASTLVTTTSVPVLCLTNPLSSMLVAGLNMTITPSGNTFVFAATTNGVGGGTSNSIANQGGFGTNISLFGSSAFNGTVSGSMTGTLNGLNVGNAINATNLIGSITAAQVTSNMAIAQLTNAIQSGLITAGTNIWLNTNSPQGTISISWILQTNYNGLRVTNNVTVTNAGVFSFMGSNSVITPILIASNAMTVATGNWTNTTFGAGVLHSSAAGLLTSSAVLAGDISGSLTQNTTGNANGSTNFFGTSITMVGPLIVTNAGVNSTIQSNSISTTGTLSVTGGTSNNIGGTITVFASNTNLFNTGFFVESNTPANWPTVPGQPGRAYTGNSNGAIFILTSVSSATWNKTNYICGP